MTIPPEAKDRIIERSLEFAAFLRLEVERRHAESPGTNPYQLVDDAREKYAQRHFGSQWWRELLLIAGGALTSPMVEQLLDGTGAVAARYVLALLVGIVCIWVALLYRP